jgi:hypothetical protein
MVAFPLLALYLLSQVPAGIPYRTLNVVVYVGVLGATAVGFWVARQNDEGAEDEAAPSS